MTDDLCSSTPATIETIRKHADRISGGDERIMEDNRSICSIFVYDRSKPNLLLDWLLHCNGLGDKSIEVGVNSLF